ncbi:ParB N-terminal domain-containing protein [Mycobacteroides abscessus]|nr:ParB N-terminal domain-containing protein [Mycobacteroides abscessus]MDM2412261.1 ParB N-terminal domain-containing protein [Mycobacteroides abscessus]
MSNTDTAIPEDIDRTAIAFLWLDPQTLVLAENVRDNPVYAHLVPSIEANGIYTPLLARWNDEGVPAVTDGQRRLLAARELGLAKVPVIVRPHDTDDAAAREADRIVEQLTTTRDRDDISEAQFARGMQELFATKALKNAEVGKRVGLSAKEVTAWRKLTKSQAAVNAMGDRQLSMEEALIIAEFEGDDAALERLNNVSPHHIKHTAARLRQEAKIRAEYQDTAKAYAEKGFTVLDIDMDPCDSEIAYIRSEDLVHEGADQGVTQEQIDANPASWAVQLVQDYAYVHIQSGEVIDESQVDHEADDDEPAADGLVHLKQVVWQETWLADYYCADPQAVGLTPRTPPLSGVQPDETGQGGTQGHNPLSEADKAAQERRKVRELNIRGLAAQEVRREWMKTELLSARTAPKGAAAFIASQLVRHPSLLTKNDAAQTARILLGHSKSDYRAIETELAALPAGAEGRAVVILLAQVLAALEEFTPKDAWRGRRHLHQYSDYSTDYLNFLADKGYSLSDIERVVLGELSADAVYAEVEAERATAKAPKGKNKAKDTAEADLRPEDIEAQEAAVAATEDAASVA